MAACYLSKGGHCELLLLYVSFAILPISAFVFGRKRIGKALTFNTLLLYGLIIGAWNTCCGGGLIYGVLVLFVCMPVYLICLFTWVYSALKQRETSSRKELYEKIWLGLIATALLIEGALFDQL